MVSDRVPNNKGQAHLIYRTSRALSMEECLLSIVPQEPMQEQEITIDTPSTIDGNVNRSEVVHPVHENDGQQPNPEKVVNRYLPVVEGDLEERLTNDIPTGTTCARARFQCPSS